MLEWRVEDGVRFVVERLKVEARAAYRFAVQRYDSERLLFALGGVRDKPKAPSVPAIIRDEQ